MVMTKLGKKKEVALSLKPVLQRLTITNVVIGIGIICNIGFVE